MHKFKIGSFVRSSREAPLTMTTLAGLLSDFNVEIKIIDGSIDKVPLDFEADLVGISIITGTARNGYNIADKFRKRGIKVVIGGIHATIMPNEALEHADSIVIGMAERTWPRLVQDFIDGNMKKIYSDPESEETDMLLNVLPPRTDLLKKSGYMIPNTVQATRGCKHTCDFCTVPVVWPKYFKRPVADVIRDIKLMPGKYIAFNDVSLNEDPEYAKELFRAMIPLNKKWGGLATTLVANDLEMLELMRKSGCIYLLLGYESVSQQILGEIYKGFNKEKDYKFVTDCLHSYGISVQGCFVFGFDEDDLDVFAKTVQRVNELKVDIPRYSIYTPYPGTRLFKRIQQEGRIISYNWNDYDTMHVVYRPIQMTPEQLFNGFKWAYKETFKISSIFSRAMYQKIGARTVVNFMGNLTYKVFVKRLYHEERFSSPNGIKDDKI